MYIFSSEKVSATFFQIFNFSLLLYSDDSAEERKESLDQLLFLFLFLPPQFIFGRSACYSRKKISLA
jgi:hypothetical protein